jgi:hydroxymethylglutaryl-CoA lyase
MSERITLVECPRDAFQGLPGFIPTETKAAYLLSLIEAGFTRIDFGSFVSPKAVPQMRDTRQVLEAVRAHARNISLIAIVPNLRGMNDAIEAGDIRCVGYALSVSEAFQLRNFRQSLDQAWQTVDQLLERSRNAGLDLVIYLSMAFGNPYGDPWSPEAVRSFAERLTSQGIRQISLADTVGLARPQQVGELFNLCRRALPAEVELGVHLHGRPGQWQEVVMAAYSAGCRRFDGALLGIGGCPFADDDLVGNIPTEGLAGVFSKMALNLDVSEASLIKPLAKAREILEKYGRSGVGSGRNLS